VQVCDISDLPFEKDSFDSAILSLALMGTNYNKFLEEAYRVLKNNGILLVTEVSSWFIDENKFINNMDKMGFKKIFF